MIPVTQKSVTELIEKELKDGRGIEAIVERCHLSVVVHALNMTHGNQSQAARLLKTHRNNLVRWIQEAKIQHRYPGMEEVDHG